MTALKKNPKAPHFSEEMIQDCLQVMESGDIEDLFEIIPRIGVLRDGRFVQPLVSLLKQKKDVKRREFAAYSMGAMGDRAFMEPLERVFEEACRLSSSEADDLLVAVVEAIGAIGDDGAADFFMPIFESKARDRQVKKVRKCVVECLGAVAQQGGIRAMEVLLQLTGHHDPAVRARAVAEISVAYWHRPNEIGEPVLARMIELTGDRSSVVAEAALDGLRALADVGCRRAEKFFAG